MDNDFQDRIDEYLLHPETMKEEDKARFLKETEEDPKKKELYEFTKNVKDAVESRGEKLRAMAEFQRDMERNAASRHRRIWLWASGIAAVLAVGFFTVPPLLVTDSVHEGIRGGDDVFEIAAPADSTTSDSTTTDTLVPHHE